METSSTLILSDSERSEGKAPESALAAMALKLAPDGAELSYRDHIELLKDDLDFEEQGDAIYLDHPDDEARLLWAFHRPSGSHPTQVGDRNTDVAIMAFNHSRLGALERFIRLNPAVIENPDLRRHIRNRSRMLFRALVDNDFSELLEVLSLFPVFVDQACDQMINGRIWNEHYATALRGSQFLELSGALCNDRLVEGVIRRLRPLKHQTFDEAKALLVELCDQARKLHPKIKEHYVEEFDTWMKREKLHPLQMIVLTKQIALLKDSHV
ncbi:hypothetical protein Sulku_1546 [Sulfuricurvum kujiense DSM 16994]|uniref:Uncharacterized protein n=1 Tax=Sulfuricurvum kujiense (strain ATCC BAA-921 / DSM 16994 / JCM 11577 / YK-1) TaxID=709032 RepID=E4TZV1_SULKY|nr:hypothetical protein [Sulfuricurvum kujiense]ADR34208.1 hypothetical protein Sulku_1546 [Sulfuricurvum kujiense DSM 16994]